MLEAESLYNQGIRLEDQGQYDQAAEAFNKAISAVNNYFPAWLHRGRVELLRDQPAAAMMFLEAAAGLKPSDSQALHWRGDAYLRTGDPQKAIQDYSQGIPIEQDNFERAEMYTSRGEAYLQLKRNDEALSDYSAAIRWNAVSAEPYYQRGVLLETIGKFRDASADFAVALAMNPGLEKAKQARLRVTALMTQQASAAPPPVAGPAPQPAVVTAAPIQASPAAAPAPLPYLIAPSSQAPANSGTVASQPTAPITPSATTPAAVTAPAPASTPAPQPQIYNPPAPVRTRVAEYRPTPPTPGLSASAIRDAQLRWKEGVDLVNQHKELDAIPLFDESLRLNPNNAQAYNGRGFARLLLKEYVPAIRDFDEALRLNPQYTNAQWNRSVAIRESSRAGSTAQNVTPKKAEPPKAASQPVVNVSQPVAKAPQPAVKAFDLWQNGRKLIAEGKYQNAVEQFDEAIRRDASFAQAYNARGFAWLLLRQYQRALADFEVALKIEPQYENAAHNRRVALQAASVAARREGM